MHTIVVDGIEEFQRLEPVWRRLYDLDPQAHVFLSFDWLKAYLALWKFPLRVVLVSRSTDPSDAVAALPLIDEATGDAGQRERRLCFAGGRTADCSGLIALPEAEETAVPALAAAVADLGFDTFDARSLSLSPSRLSAFMGQFASQGNRVRWKRLVQEGSDVDHDVAPFVCLSRTWDAYLDERLGRNARQKARRFLRKLDAGEDIAVTHASDDTLRRDVEILVHLWSRRWREHKGEHLATHCSAIARNAGAFLQAGLIDLLVLWLGTRPICAHALYIDPVKRRQHFWIGGRDPDVSAPPPPGFVLHCYAIRRAIGAGYRIYDFLRGNEPYKYDFGAVDRPVPHLVVRAAPAAAPRPVEAADGAVAVA